VVIKDAPGQIIEQPTLHFGTATQVGQQIIVPINLEDGMDNAVSKDLRIDLKLSGITGLTLPADAFAYTNARQVILAAGETSTSVIINVPTGTVSGDVKLEITGVTPMRGSEAYAEYSNDRARLRDLFFEDPAGDRKTEFAFVALPSPSPSPSHLTIKASDFGLSDEQVGDPFSAIAAFHTDRTLLWIADDRVCLV
jgi:hypothetical protein